MAKRTTTPPPAEKDRPVLRGLLAGCKADLDDDAPRRVLADWLEEHGDDTDRARAELIRIQLDLPRVNLHYPGGSDAWLRRGELIARHGKDWLGPLVFLCQRRSARFERGLVVLEVEPRQFLTQYAGTLAGSEAYAWVEGLSFRRRLNTGDVHDVLDSPLFDPITRLEVAGADLGAEGIRRLARSPRLARITALALHSATPGPAQVQELAASTHLANLVWLDLSYNPRLTADDVIPWLTAPGLARLTRLDLHRTNIHSAGLGKLLASCRLPRLHSLDLSMNGLDDTADLGALPALPALAWLNLGRTRPGEKALGRLAGADLPRLAELSLHECEITPAALAAFGRASFLPGLRSLVLRSNRIEAPGLRGLARGPGLPGLRLLNLDINPLQTQGVAALTALELPRLEQLSLARCQVGPRGAARLARWPSLAGVRSLNLDKNALGPDGLRALLGSPHLTALVSLDLSHNGLDDEGVEALAASPLLARLETLRLDDAFGSRAVTALTGSPHTGNLRRLRLGLMRYRFEPEAAKKLRRHFGGRLQ
jgi:uncharacterized protein (TIGR02996 family)